MLEGLYKMGGEQKNAAMAAQPRGNAEAPAARGHHGHQPVLGWRTHAGGEHIRAFLLKHGNQVEAMRLLARIGMARGVLDDAELLLESVLVLAPDYRAARYDYALALIERHKYQAARIELEKLLTLEPGNAQFRTLYAATCVGLGEHDKAIPLYRELLKETPRAPDLHLSVAHALKTVGRREEAIGAYRAAAAARPGFGDAYWSLANLKTYRFLDAEIAAMRAAEAAAETPIVDRYHLCFALGKAHEDRGEYAESWRCYERGNALKRSESRYRPEVIENNTRKQIEICTPRVLRGAHGLGRAGRRSDLHPRTATLGIDALDQILASHSRVEGTQELADIQRFVLDLQGRDPDLDNPRYPGVLGAMKREDFRRLGEKYLADTRVYRTGRPHFIDKMPNNFRHIGLIHLMLPNAHDHRRAARADGLLLQQFQAAVRQRPGVHLRHRRHRALLPHLSRADGALGSRCCRAGFCGCCTRTWSTTSKAACGESSISAAWSSNRPASSSTRPNAMYARASSEQVRQPIFREGLDQWRHYEPWLAPLRKRSAMRW